MKVKELIRELKKQDPDAVVGWADNDALDGEVSAHVRCVDEREPVDFTGDGYAMDVRVLLRP